MNNTFIIVPALLTVHNNVAALVAGGVINAEVLAVRIVTVLTKA
jgi:hypothetical protein